MDKTNETLVNLVYAEKRVTKAQIKNIDINFIIQNTNVEKLNLKQLTVVFVALAKVIQKRMKSLLEDANHTYQLLNRTQIQRMPRKLASKNITLNIQNSNLFINDEMIDFGEDAIVKELENVIDAPSFLDAGFEVEFGGNQSIEQVRNSTMVESTLFNDTNLSINIKRRKVVEDKTIELTETVFRANLRTAYDILTKDKKEENNVRETKLEIDEKLIKFLDSLKHTPTIEEHRNQAFEVDYQEPEFSFNPIEASKEQRVDSESTNTSFLLDLSTLPTQFDFTGLIEGHSKENKIHCFLELLTLATEGKIQIEQSNLFGSIECKIIK